MATKIRLQRHGKKGKPFFHIVAADTRAKRDGKFIEKLGIYNPNTNPATIEVDFEKCLNWLKNGAERTDTANAILKYKGVVYKYHLDRGVTKGAMTQEQADAKFEAWLKEKEAKISGKASNLAKAAQEAENARLKAETEIKEARAKEIAAKNSELAAAAAAEENATEETANETEAPATKETADTENAAPTEEKKEEKAAE